MTVGAFAELAEDFLHIMAATVFCTATTVDANATSARADAASDFHPPRRTAARLGAHGANAAEDAVPCRQPPHVLRLLDPRPRTPVFVDCVAVWAEAVREKQEVWELFRGTPPPLGYGPEGMAGYAPEQWRSPEFTPLRLEPVAGAGDDRRAVPAWPPDGSRVARRIAASRAGAVSTAVAAML